MDGKTKLIQSTIIYMVSLLLPQAINFLMLPIYTRYMTPSDFGIWGYTTGISSFLALLSSFGFHSYYLRFYYHSKNVRDFNGSVFLFLAAYNTIIYSLLLLFMPLVFTSVRIKIHFFPYMFLALISQYLLSYDIIPSRTFRIRQEVMKYFFRVLLRTVSLVGTNIIFLVILKKGVVGKYYADLITNSLLAAIMIAYMVKNLNITIKRRIIKEGFKFAYPITLSDLLNVTVSSGDRIIMERYVDMSSIGIYSMGNTIANIMSMVTTSIYQTLEPIIYKNAEDPGFNKKLPTYQAVIMVPVLIFCTFTGLFSEELLKILTTQKYWAAYHVVQYLSVGIVFAALATLTNSVCMVYKKTFVMTISSFTGAVATILLNISLLGSWGIFAAGVSRIISYLLIVTVSVIILYRKYYRISIKKEIIAVIAQIAIYLFFNYIKIDAFFPAICIKSMTIIMYTLFVAFIYDISNNPLFKEMFIDKFKRKLMGLRSVKLSDYL